MMGLSGITTQGQPLRGVDGLPSTPLTGAENCLIMKVDQEFDTCDFIDFNSEFLHFILKLMGFVLNNGFHTTNDSGIWAVDDRIGWSDAKL